MILKSICRLKSCGREQEEGQGVEESPSAVRRAAFDYRLRAWAQCLRVAWLGLACVD